MLPKAEQRVRDKARRFAQSLKSGPCAECGATKNINAHHEDYTQPNAVIWLCSEHHGKRHRRPGVKPKTLPPGKTQANWIIRQELKDWVDREAAKRDIRPAYVIEECIKIMQETTR